MNVLDHNFVNTQPIDLGLVPNQSWDAHLSNPVIRSQKFDLVEKLWMKQGSILFGWNIEHDCCDYDIDKHGDDSRNTFMQDLLTLVEYFTMIYNTFQVSPTLIQHSKNIVNFSKHL